MSEKVSIVMSLYDEKINYLDECLNSIKCQTYKNFELIIVNDNPFSNFKFSDIEKYKFSNLKYLKNKKNIGLAASLNKAIKISSGDYICRMDADDIMHKDRLHLQIELLKNGNYDLVGSNTIIIDEKSRPIGKYLIEKKNLQESLVKNQLIPHPTWIFKRFIFSSVKYNEIFIYSQDYDFINQVIKSGFKVGVHKEALLYYRRSTAQVSYSKVILQKTYKNIIFDKYYRNFDYKNNDIESRVNKSKKLSNSLIFNLISRIKIKKIRYILYFFLSKEFRISIINNKLLT